MTATAGTPTSTTRRRGHRRWWRGCLAVVVIFALGCGGVLVDALRLPGTDSPAAKLAEWGRDHGLGGLVTGLESVSYQIAPPPVGGAPAVG
jgi:hypothetical protein